MHGCAWDSCQTCPRVSEGKPMVSDRRRTSRRIGLEPGRAGNSKRLRVGFPCSIEKRSGGVMGQLARVLRNMGAVPGISAFGIDQSFGGPVGTNNDPLPVLDVFFKKMLDELYDG